MIGARCETEDERKQELGTCSRKGKRREEGGGGWRRGEGEKSGCTGGLLHTHRCNPSGLNGLNGLQPSSGEDSPNVTYAQRKDKRDSRGPNRICLTQIFSYMFGMALVNLPINRLPINSVKWPIRRLIPIQHPTEMVPVTDIRNIESKT
jgi:hypothetical protein